MMAESSSKNIVPDKNVFSGSRQAKTSNAAGHVSPSNAMNFKAPTWSSPPASDQLMPTIDQRHLHQQQTVHQMNLGKYKNMLKSMQSRGRQPQNTSPTDGWKASSQNK